MAGDVLHPSHVKILVIKLPPAATACRRPIPTFHPLLKYYVPLTLFPCKRISIMLRCLSIAGSCSCYLASKLRFTRRPAFRTTTSTAAA